ncbi:MAG: AbrB/MazE/SpoVT family DNA-binding domain-containing protein [Lachnospiraceae bacterium]|nr:AbrB/MazE/SpoVT family DNA-binding domain-containing protein [Lachnospiraceae bacterium]
MNVAISKWGNSLGVRVPVIISESLGLKAGDQVDFELKDGGMFMKKKQSTAEMFEQFYGKPFSEITQADIDPMKEIDWGEDVGGEVF